MFKVKTTKYCKSPLILNLKYIYSGLKNFLFRWLSISSYLGCHIFWHICSFHQGGECAWFQIFKGEFTLWFSGNGYATEVYSLKCSHSPRNLDFMYKWFHAEPCKKHIHEFRVFFMRKLYGNISVIFLSKKKKLKQIPLCHCFR